MADSNFTQSARQQIARSSPAGLVALLRHTLTIEQEVIDDVHASALTGLGAFPDLREAPSAVRMFSVIGRLMEDAHNRIFIDLLLEELAARLGPVEAVQ